jgi:hypothetical protein
MCYGNRVQIIDRNVTESAVGETFGMASMTVIQ